MNDFEKWLDTFLNFEKTPVKDIFWLDTMKHLCDVFDNPEKAYSKIHVAGSKGKGTVSCMMASILQEHGFNTGLYTSPHILSFFERICSPSSLFTEEVYQNAEKIMTEKHDEFNPINLPANRNATWFELVTLFAFLCFREAKCDWAVIETGLGGRLDSTNVIQPEASVIMPIELEHTEFLGDTLAKIASEKAGIIKANVPVFVSRQKPEAKEVFIQKARETNSTVYFFDEFVSSYTYDVKDEKSLITITFDKKYEQLFPRPLNLKLNFLGEIQAMNAAIAAFTVKTLQNEIPLETIEKGLEKAKLPARFEIAGYDNVKCVLDGAHTANSMNLTTDTFHQLYPGAKTILFACAKDKNMKEMSRIILEKGFENIIITKPGSVKSSDLTELESDFIEKINQMGLKEKVNLITEENTEKAFEKALNVAKKNKTELLVTGSFYLIADIKMHF